MNRNGSALSTHFPLLIVDWESGPLDGALDGRSGIAVGLHVGVKLGATEGIKEGNVLGPDDGSVLD